MQQLKKFIPEKFKIKFRQFVLDYFDGYCTKSYSQEGEDMILRRIFESVDRGFYVDIGAHHPKRFSNTYYFYKIGWRGINIDARPGSMVEFNRSRPRDINIEAAIDKERRELTYYMFDEPALNTFDAALAKTRNSSAGRITAEINIFTQKLDDILEKNLPDRQKIDFMSIDVEGLDLEVLQSNNWDLFRPDYILVECSKTSLRDMENDEICRFMSDRGYAFFAKTLKTVIYARLVQS
jgi:FkbM family methyltransferase